MSDSIVPGPSAATSVSLDTEKKLRDTILMINVMYAVGFLLGFTVLVGVVIAYLRRGVAAGTIWESHFTYAVRTFWFGLVMGIIAVILCFVVIGFVLLALVTVWYIIRVVRGFIAWNDGTAIANPKRFW